MICSSKDLVLYSNYPKSLYLRVLLCKTNYQFPLKIEVDKKARNTFAGINIHQKQKRGLDQSHK